MATGQDAIPLASIGISANLPVSSALDGRLFGKFFVRKLAPMPTLFVSLIAIVVAIILSLYILVKLSNDVLIVSRTKKICVKYSFEEDSVRNTVYNYFTNNNYSNLKYITRSMWMMWGVVVFIPLYVFVAAGNDISDQASKFWNFNTKSKIIAHYVVFALAVLLCTVIGIISYTLFVGNNADDSDKLAKYGLIIKDESQSQIAKITTSVLITITIFSYRFWSTDRSFITLLLAIYIFATIFLHLFNYFPRKIKSLCDAYKEKQVTADDAIAKYIETVTGDNKPLLLKYLAENIARINSDASGKAINTSFSNPNNYATNKGQYWRYIEQNRDDSELYIDAASRIAMRNMKALESEFVSATNDYMVTTWGFVGCIVAIVSFIVFRTASNTFSTALIIFSFIVLVISAMGLWITGELYWA